MIQRRSKKEAGAVWCISCREAWLLSPYLANRSPSSSRTGPNSSTCSKAALASTLALVGGVPQAGYPSRHRKWRGRLLPPSGGATQASTTPGFSFRALVGPDGDAIIRVVS